MPMLTPISWRLLSKLHTSVFPEALLTTSTKVFQVQDSLSFVKVWKIWSFNNLLIWGPSKLQDLNFSIVDPGGLVQYMQKSHHLWQVISWINLRFPVWHEGKMVLRSTHKRETPGTISALQVNHLFNLGIKFCYPISIERTGTWYKQLANLAEIQPFLKRHK